MQIHITKLKYESYNYIVYFSPKESDYATKFKRLIVSAEQFIGIIGQNTF